LNIVFQSIPKKRRRLFPSRDVSMALRADRAMGASVTDMSELRDVLTDGSWDQALLSAGVSAVWLSKA
jgi:hypothetical protein